MQKAYGGLVAFESNVAQIPFDRSRMEQKSLTKHALLSTTVIFDSTMAAQHDDGDNDDDDPVHAMAPFLEERLPALGLDYETYGPYILPLLTTNDKDDDVDGGVPSSDNEADEEWNTVLELLQASSSLEDGAADDIKLWLTFRSDIETAWRKRRIYQRQKRAAQQSRLALAAQEQMEHDRQLALLAKERQETLEQSGNNKVDDEAKRRLVEQYGYEASDDDDEEQQPGAAGGEPVVANNREVAQQLEQAKTKAMREHKVQPTKQEEQLKTKEAKKTKEMLKEERRKRAVKGERRR
jgi:hypothetical protein